MRPVRSFMVYLPLITLAVGSASVTGFDERSRQSWAATTLRRRSEGQEDESPDKQTSKTSPDTSGRNTRHEDSSDRPSHEGSPRIGPLNLHYSNIQGPSSLQQSNIQHMLAHAASPFGEMPVQIQGARSPASIGLGRSHSSPSRSQSGGFHSTRYSDLIALHAPGDPAIEDAYSTSWQWLERRLGHRPQIGVKYAFKAWTVLPTVYRFFVGTPIEMPQIKPTGTHVAIVNTGRKHEIGPHEKLQIGSTSTHTVSHRRYDWQPEEIYININPWNARPILLHNLDAFASLFSLHANYMGIARPDRNARETAQAIVDDRRWYNIAGRWAGGTNNFGFVNELWRRLRSGRR